MLEIKQVPPTFPNIGVKVDLPALAFVGVDDGEVVGSGGLAWGQGKCWIWLDVRKSRPEYAIPLMRKTKALIRIARQFGETEVFTPRDANYPTSRKLLTALKFEPFAVEQGVEIWNVRT
jgi:hypothetical protein